MMHFIYPDLKNKFIIYESLHTNVKKNFDETQLSNCN